jgi:hypothetical protein
MKLEQSAAGYTHRDVPSGLSGSGYNPLFGEYFRLL